MSTQFKNAWAYQGDAMNLPVGDVDAAIPFYTDIMGFEIVSRSDSPHRSATLARPDVQIGLAENGGDPANDGCAFEVNDVAAVFAELQVNGFSKKLPNFKMETNDKGIWKVLYVVAPDGLCYWLGEK